LLFFGFCLGDAGYGLVLLALATVFKRRSGLAQWKDVLTLAQFFGVSTIVFGIVSGTFFGLSLLNFDLGISIQDYVLDNNGLLALALVLGFVQILFGLAIRSVRNWLERGPVYALSGIGWMILMPTLALSSQEIGPEWLGKLAYPALALIIIPNKPESGWKSPLFGILDLYNITGFIGDLLSYIRLFALGISSAILGLVVNTIALKSLGIPFIGPVIFVFLLVVGHGGNLMLASLSAFDHQLRLTFVEFYKNAGFNGGGKPFKPFSQTLK
jgi:V/A-type H+-transporting ATPase subunit I